MSDTSNERSMEFEVEVRATVEDAWRAVSTAEGISSWYVPHTMDDGAGTMTASFGPGPEMQVPCRIAVIEAPRRIVLDGGEGVVGLVFEWLVEPIDDTHTRIRLVNTGFGEGPEADAMYEGMLQGWNLFMLNLQLHLENFAGQSANAGMASGVWAGPRDSTWTALRAVLDMPSALNVGDRMKASAADTPAISGEVVDVQPWRLAVLLDEPAPGTVFIAVEGQEQAAEINVSIWTYLYGPDRAELAADVEQRWGAWLQSRGLASGE